MTGLDQFLDSFGNMTISHVVMYIIAGIFLYGVYKKIKEYLIKKHDIEKKRENDIQEALCAVRKYPEYRQQSVRIQEELKNDISTLRHSQEETRARLERMEETTKRRDRNKLRDTLLQNYRYYTNEETNPSQSWTKMESEAFWELFKDYEDAGGNGYVHTDVQPAMAKLTIIEVGKK